VEGQETSSMRIKEVPTVGAIQRTTVVVAGAAAAVLLMAVSPASAVACIIGAALMVANMYALSWTVRTMFAFARQAGGVTAFGLAAAPLKMLLLAGIAYLIIESGVNLPGFIAGSLTQFAAIFIEVGRVSLGDKLAAPSA
jgi:hypothetical protein